VSAADLVVIGAGPAGLAAAASAAGLGLATQVLDEQPEPGGQIFREIERVAASHPALFSLLGEDYGAGLELLGRFRASGARHLPRATVWQIDDERRVYYRHAAGAASIQARQVLIATGALERPVPVPGWTLPGVMSCGAAQTLLKSAALVPDGRVVLAGSGPLLLLVAVQLLRAGIRPAAVLETPIQRFAALRHLPRFAAAPGYLNKGLAMLRELRASGVPFRRGVRGLAVSGAGRAEAVRYDWRGRRREQDVDLVLLHQGLAPNLNLALSLRCEHLWDESQRCFRPRLDPWGACSVPGVWIAGDGGGIAGARAAECSGALAALAAACSLGRISKHERDARAKPFLRERERHLAARAFLDTLYRPPAEILAPSEPRTVVCRCEEVTAGEIRRLATEQDCPGPNQMKAFTRCGMGPCQGRLCGLTVTELIAESRNISPAEAGYYRIRPPVKPVTVGDLAELDV